MGKKDYLALAAIIQRNLVAARACDAYRAHGDVHQSLMRQVAYDICRYCASRNARFKESIFLVACGLSFDK